MIILTWLIFIISIFVLVKSSDFFIDSASKIGLHFNLSEFLIGIIILAFGTSLPELATSIIAAIQNHTEVVIADVFGSNITNILLVLGLASIFSKKGLKSTRNLDLIDLPILTITTFLVFLFVFDKQIVLYEGVFLLIGFLIYLYYNLSIKKEKDHKIQKTNLFLQFFF